MPSSLPHGAAPRSTGIPAVDTMGNKEWSEQEVPMATVKGVRKQWGVAEVDMYYPASMRRKAVAANDRGHGRGEHCRALEGCHDRAECCR